MKLALQLIDQIAEDAYDPSVFQDEEKKRVLAAIDAKIAGKQIVASARNEEPSGGQVIDLMEALRASLRKPSKAAAAAEPAAVPVAKQASRKAAAPDAATQSASSEPIPIGALAARKPVRRAAKVAGPEPIEVTVAPKSRARK